MQHFIDDPIDIILTGINKLSGNACKQFLELDLFFIFVSRWK